MKNFLFVPLMLATGCATQSALPNGAHLPNPEAPKTFLQRIVGSWEYDQEAVNGPGQPPQKSKGTEDGRMVGPWAVMEIHGESAAGPYTGILTIGPTADPKRYVGTWISSMSPDMVQYQQCSLDESGRVLTLDTLLPDPTDPTKQTRFRDVFELVDDGHKTLRSMMEMNGSWTTFVTANYRRR